MRYIDPALAMTEAQLQKAVIDMMHTFRWRVAHFRPAMVRCRKCSGQGCQACKGKGLSWRTAVEADGAGFPDLFATRKHQVVCAELKAQSGVTSPEQDAWLNAMGAAGIPSYVWRPSDWRSGAIEEVLR